MQVSLSADMPESYWPDAIDASGFMDDSDTSSRTDAFAGGHLNPINVLMEPGMWKDNISIIVTISGLQYRS